MLCTRLVTLSVEDSISRELGLSFPSLNPGSPQLGLLGYDFQARTVLFSSLLLSY